MENKLKVKMKQFKFGLKFSLGIGAYFSIFGKKIVAQDTLEDRFSRAGGIKFTRLM